ncbi:hypothetical protein Nepgr_001873 [Nepenthes gracilis]|uniref:Uncharacterized protein n=1 Tax=Nepenthes gracilis TaxID=150966 RepID=A0AAD3RXD7_NEPGR|nr:hypothetical protein Nepgr_001873 [Nepenthes gracilis]
MKRLRSYGDDLGSASEKELDRDRTASFLSSHHRRFYLKTAENGRSRSVIDNNLDRDTSRGSRKRIESNLDGFNDRDGSRSLRKRLDHDSGDNLNDRDGLRGTRKRLDHDLDCFDDREGSRISRKGVDVDFPDNFDERAGSRVVRKRFEHENDGFDRMNGLDRHRERDGSDRGGRVPSLVSPRDGHAGGRPRYRERDKDWDKIHRSESFCTGRRDFPRGFRSERDRLKGEESVSSWHRFGSRSKRDGDEEVKSSAGETAASSSSRGGMDGGSSRESVKSPQKSKDVRSPTWSKESKDSGGESLKTVKKNKSLASESGGSSNGTEIEEGELQPDPHLEPEPHSAFVQVVKHIAELEDMVDVGKDTKQNDSEFCQNMESTLASTVKLAKEGNVMSDKEVKNENEQDGAEEAAEEDVLRESDKLLISHNNSRHKVSVGDEVKASEGKGSGDASDNENWKKDHPEFSAPSHCKLDNHGDEEGIDRICMPKPLTSTQEENLANGIDLEVGVADVNVPDPSESMVEDDPKEPELNMHTIKDKGKGVALCCSPDEVNFTENGNLIERNFIAWRDDAMEGPSSRGFELFWTCAKVKQPKLPEDEHEMKKLEPLDLSLGLPNVSLPAPSNNAAAPPNSPPHARSVQSLATTFRTGSDCFTTSISFSGSQFIHNPSCSLTHNSLDCDYERSVKSRPLFQDVDWEAQNADDSKPKELPTFPKLVSNSNGSLHLPHGSHGMLSSQAMQGQHGMLLGWMVQEVFRDSTQG